jgi:hypothetical protein
VLDLRPPTSLAGWHPTAGPHLAHRQPTFRRPPSCSLPLYAWLLSRYLQTPASLQSDRLGRAWIPWKGEQGPARPHADVADRGPGESSPPHWPPRPPTAPAPSSSSFPCFALSLSLPHRPLSPASQGNVRVRPWVPRGQGGESQGGAPCGAGEAAFFGSACIETLWRVRFRAASRTELFCAPVWHGSSLRTRSGAAGSRAKRTPHRRRCRFQ